MYVRVLTSDHSIILDSLVSSHDYEYNEHEREQDEDGSTGDEQNGWDADGGGDEWGGGRIRQVGGAIVGVVEGGGERCWFWKKRTQIDS